MRFVSRKQEKEVRLVVQQYTAHASDVVAMARFVVENTHLVQVEYVFTSRDAERQKMIKKEDEAYPS